MSILRPPSASIVPIVPAAHLLANPVSLDIEIRYFKEQIVLYVP